MHQFCLQVISLPECFNSPYGTKYFPEYAEPLIDGPTTNTLKAAAEKNKVCYNNCRADEMVTLLIIMLCIRIKSIISEDFAHDIGLFDWWILSRARNNRWNRKTLQHDNCMVSKWGNDWKIS